MNMKEFILKQIIECYKTEIDAIERNHQVEMQYEKEEDYPIDYKYDKQIIDSQWGMIEAYNRVLNEIDKTKSAIDCIQKYEYVGE